MIIKCCKNDGELEFSEREGLLRPAGQEYFRVTIRSNHLFSYTDVYIFDPYDYNLVRFFEDLSKNWKGLDSKKEWCSLEGELSLSCTSDSIGHFDLEVVIRNTDETRYAKKIIYLEAGQLEKIALQVRNFFNISQN